MHDCVRVSVQDTGHGTCTDGNQATKDAEPVESLQEALIVTFTHGIVVAEAAIV